MKKDPKIFIAHILDSIEKIEEFTKEVSKKEFLESNIIQDAVIRRIEIIGEAAKNLPKNIKSEYPEVPWKEIIGTRDKIVHEYFGVDLDLTYRIAKEDIPDLKQKILKVLEDISGAQKLIK